MVKLQIVGIYERVEDMFVWLNLVSFLLGLIAWMLPFINLARGKKSNILVGPCFPS
jgi:hypothetical protein